MQTPYHLSRLEHIDLLVLSSLASSSEVLIFQVVKELLKFLFSLIIELTLF